MTTISNEDILNKNLVEYLPEFFEALKDRIVDFIGIRIGGKFGF